MPQYENYIFEIIEDERENEYGSSCIAKTRLSSGEEVRVRLSFNDQQTSQRFGHLISAHTRLELPSETAAPYLWSKGVLACARIYSFEACERKDLFGVLITLRDGALACVGQETKAGSALLRAILFGERSGLEEGGFYQDIRVVGLAHLVAVSGSHLVIVSASLQVLLGALRIPRKALVIIQVIFLVLYLVLTGMPISALRAACMSLVSLLSFYPGKRSSSLNALGVCVMLMVVIDPWSAISVSFLLSSLSTLGIIVLVALFMHWFQHFIPRIPRAINESISLTLAASILITPLVMAFFSQLSIISPLMNVIAAPCFTLLCVGGLVLVLVSLMFPSFGHMGIELAQEASELFCSLVRYVADIPYAAICAHSDFFAALIMSFALLICIWCVWPRPRALWLVAGAATSAVAAFIIICIVPLSYSDEVIMLDVGQGDAFVVCSKGANILIDTGKQDAALLRGLGRCNITHLDAVVISHADDDHCGSLASLRSFVQVDRVCVAKPALTCECASCARLRNDACTLVGEKGLMGLSVGEKLQVGAFDLEVIWPDVFVEEGGNADSLTLLLSKENPGMDGKTLTGQSMLFCGDAEAEQLHAMVEKKRLAAVDVYKVGHHGSKHALDDELAGILQPRLALVSAGKNNRYGHPADVTLLSLEHVGTKIMRSDEEGDLVCKFEFGSLEVSALR